MLGLLGAWCGGCDGAGSSGSTGQAATGTSATSATATASSATPTVTAEAPPAPQDLDVPAAQKALGCGANAKGPGPCAVLAGFAACKPWSAEVPSGDGRFVGRGYEVASKKATESVLVFRARRVPLAEVGTGQLPIRLGIGTIEKGDGSAYSQADRLIRTFERADVPSKGNPTIEHLKTMTTFSEAFATRTLGGHVFGLSHGGLFACEGPKRQLFMIRRAATRSGQGDGLYAELWAATW